MSLIHDDAYDDQEEDPFDFRGLGIDNAQSTTLEGGMDGTLEAACATQQAINASSDSSGVCRLENGPPVAHSKCVCVRN